MHRFLNILIALTLVSTVILGIVRLKRYHSPATSQASPDTISLDPIRIGETQYHDVVLDIPRDIADEDVTKVLSSCGCAMLTDWSFDKTHHTIHVKLETQPDAYTTAGVATTLSVYTGDTVADDVSVTSDILSPFDGWPDAAQGTIDHDSFRLAVHDAYADAPMTFRCYDKDENEIKVQRISRSEIMISGIDPKNVAHDTLVVSFAFDQDHPTVWAGPLAVSSEK